MGKIVRVFKDIEKTTKRHSPEILTGIGIASMITSTVLAIKATPKAFMILEEKKYEEDIDTVKPLDAVKATWKCYIPTVVTGVVGVTCLVCSNRVSARRNAAIAAAYAISESTLKEYKDKVVETIGEEKEREVRQSIAQDRAEREPKLDAIQNDIWEDCPCLEALTNTPFMSNEIKLRKALNDLNYKIRNHDYASLNEWFDMIEIERVGIGDDLGWRVDVHGQIDLDIYPGKTKNGTACLIVDYMQRPTYNYNTWL